MVSKDMLSLKSREGRLSLSFKFSVPLLQLRKALFCFLLPQEELLVHLSLHKTGEMSNLNLKQCIIKQLLDSVL